MIIIAPRLLRLIGKLFGLSGTPDGMAFWPFILFKEQETAYNSTVVTHERIHLRQQRELLLVGFWYLYMRDFRCYGYHKNRFEQEAYANQHNPNYLKTRKRWSWRAYTVA
jgi:hypothetical protein